MAKLQLKWLAKQPSSGSVKSVVVLIVCVVVAAALFFNRQVVVDQLSVWQYQPSGDVAALAQRATMSDSGKFYFYTSHPAIEEAEKFNQECTKQEDSTAILGCYNGQNIFIYNVTDSKLDGIKEVTAAHEMLHVVYSRLSDDEKIKINTLLEAEYEKIKNNTDFAERMLFYARTEPGERMNELHSIIGTEVSAIAPELEAYYKKYFTDRSSLVALHEKYASIFLALQRQSEALAAQLDTLGVKIEAQSAAYNTNTAQLSADITAFNTKASNGGFSSQVQFQGERNALLARARQLELARGVINTDISKYNQLRDELQTISSQSEALNRSINSSLAPAPTL